MLVFNILMYIILIFISIIIIYEILRYVYIVPQKKELCISVYKSAKQHAKLINKKLLVIGSPFTGVYHESGEIVPWYNCGDLCIDLVGCGTCDNQIKADLSILKELPTDEYVIFESETIEFVDDIKNIINEMKRVSNNRIYSVHTIGGMSFDFIKNNLFLLYLVYTIRHFERLFYSILTNEGFAKRLIVNSHNVSSNTEYYYINYLF